MSDGCREQLGWKISADLWARYKRRVNSEWGETSPYTGIQIEQSWREYHAGGSRHTLEEVSQKIVAATGRSQNAIREKIPVPGSMPTLRRQPCGFEFTRMPRKRWQLLQTSQTFQNALFSEQC